MTVDAEIGLERWSARDFEEEAAHDLGQEPSAPVAAKPRPQTLAEERANTITHGLGFVLAALGLIVFIFEATTYGSVHHIAGCGIFGATLVTTYLASTLYHSAQHPRLKHWLRVCDHITIYLLIAGTYTPFMLVSLGGELGWLFFCIVWGLAFAGTLFKLVAFGKYTRVSLASYLGMGWLAVFVVEPLWAQLPGTALLLMAAGGLSYSFGVIFYVQDDKRFYHTIWHLFVMAGSACHYIAVLLYVLPATPAS